MTTYHQTKQKYQAALIENLKKDLILHKLLNQEAENEFVEFTGQFPAKTLMELCSLDKAEKNDSSFILTAVRGLYSNDLTQLKNKTYSGYSKTNTKECISPEKIKCLRDIFEKRLELIELSDIFVDDARKNKFPKHVKNAIVTINKSKK